MRQTLGCAVVLALVVGCGKTKPPRTSALSSPESSASESTSTAPAAKAAEKPNYLANVLKPRAEVATGHPRKEYESSRLYLNRDGTRIVAGLMDGTVTQVWDLRDPPKKLCEVRGAAGPMSPDGKLFVRNGGLSAEVIDAETGKVVSTIESLWGFQFRAPGSLLAYRKDRPKPDEPFAYLVRRFDPATGKAAEGFTVPVNGDMHVSWGAAGELVVGTVKTKKVQVWDVAAKKVVREYSLPVGDRSVWSNFAVTPDGKRFLAGAGKGFEVFDANTGESLGLGAQLSLGPLLVPGRDLVLERHTFGDEKFKVHSGYVAYDYRQKKPVAFLPADGFAEAVSDDGRVAVLTTKAGNLTVWDLTQVP